MTKGLAETEAAQRALAEQLRGRSESALARMERQRQRARDYQQRRRDKAREEGKCVACRDALAVEGKTKCRACAKQDRDFHRRAAGWSKTKIRRTPTRPNAGHGRAANPTAAGTSSQSKRSKTR